MTKIKGVVEVKLLDKISFEVLQTIANSPISMTIREISQKINHGWYTVQNRIDDLLIRGYIELFSSGKYKLSPIEKIKKITAREKKSEYGNPDDF